MTTRFINLGDKRTLMDAMINGSKNAAEYAIAEIQRLESIIRDYEMVIDMATEKVLSNTFKTPKPFLIQQREKETTPPINY